MAATVVAMQSFPHHGLTLAVACQWHVRLNLW